MDSHKALSEQILQKLVQCYMGISQKKKEIHE